MLSDVQALSPPRPRTPTERALPPHSGDVGSQRPGRPRWFPHVYWKSDTRRLTQSAPRGVLKFIPTVGCVTCRLDRLPKSWKTAQGHTGSVTPPSCHPRPARRGQIRVSRKEHCWGHTARQAWGPLGTLTRSFSISLVSGSTSMISWSRAETWGQKGDGHSLTRPRRHRGVPVHPSRSRPTANGLLEGSWPFPHHPPLVFPHERALAACRGEGLQQQNAPGGRDGGQLSGRDTMRGPAQGEEPVPRQGTAHSRPDQLHARAAERSRGWVRRCAGCCGHRRHSCSPCDARPQGRSPTTALLDSNAE